MKDGYNPFQTTGINFFRHRDEMIKSFTWVLTWSV